MKKILLVLAVLMLFANLVFAKKPLLIEKHDLTLGVASSAAFMTTELPIVFDFDGIKFTVVGTYPIAYLSSELSKNERFYSKGDWVAMIKGVEFEIENTTSDVASINWGKSIMSANRVQVGTPFLSSMKFTDAGNPNATPDTIVIPNSKVKIAAYTPFVRFAGGGWLHEGLPLLRGDTLNISYYLHISINGVSKYYNLDLPGLIAMKDYPAESDKKK